MAAWTGRYPTPVAMWRPPSAARVCVCVWWGPVPAPGGGGGGGGGLRVRLISWFETITVSPVSMLRYTDCCHESSTCVYCYVGCVLTSVVWTFGKDILESILGGHASSYACSRAATATAYNIPELYRMSRYPIPAPQAS